MMRCFVNIILLFLSTMVISVYCILGRSNSFVSKTTTNVIASSSVDTMASKSNNNKHRRRGIISKYTEHSSDPTILSPLETVAAVFGVVQKPFRDVNFWSRAIHIYSSYKILQLKNSIGYIIKKPFISSLSSSTSYNNNDKSAEEIKKITDKVWDLAHEANSKRMINLCLQLRGFYLKTGQFLGTRHDFMPTHYTTKLSKLHDDVPPLEEKTIRKIIEKELKGPIDKYFIDLDLKAPIGAASVAQVHTGTWRETGEKVAVKVQYPNAKRLMTGDLKNLRALAEFLQRTEFKFDLLSSIKELQKQIVNEFNFPMEAKNMDFIKMALAKSCPDVEIPRSICVTKKVLIMSYVEGNNLCRLAEFKQEDTSVPVWVKKRLGTKVLDTAAKVWGEMIFNLQFFNADPHPGNINLDLHANKLGVLDWGQMKHISDDALVKFSRMILAINSGNQDRILKAFNNLGIKMTNPQDKRGCEIMALSMLDTKKIPGYTMDPFSPDSPLLGNTICEMPSDLYFLVRTVQLMRGCCFAFGLDYSLSRQWAPAARKVLAEHGLKEFDDY